MGKAVTASVLVPGVTPARVWNLLTDAEQLKGWFCEQAEVDLPGGVYRFWGKYTPDTPGPLSQHVKLVSFAPPGAASQAQLAFTWQLRGVETTVQYELASQDGGTATTVKHGSLPERVLSQGAIHDFWYTSFEALRLLAVTGKPQSLPQYGPKLGPALMLEVDIAAPREQVFRCLIEPEWMSKLWGDEHIKVEPAVGGVYDYGWGDGGPRRITAFDPPGLLSFTWLYPPETEETTVTWRLAELDGGITRLSLEHSGFAPDYDDEEYRAGWFSFLAIIKGICELGDAWQRVSVKGTSHGEV